MVRKMVCGLAALALVLGLSQEAKAAEELGSIRVIFEVGDLAVTKGSVALYRVGEKAGDGYRIAEDFGGGMVKEADALSPHLASWLAENAWSGGRVLHLDADGCALYDRLEDGLYLVMQDTAVEGFYPIRPFLLAVPMNGEWDVEARPKIEAVIVEEMPKTGEGPWLALGIVGMLGSMAGLLICGLGRKRRGNGRE